MALENIVGNLKNVLSQVDASTVLHAREIAKERRDNFYLRETKFWAADFLMYRMEKRKAVLYFAPREHNYLFKNIDDAVKQIRETNNYKLKQEDIDAVVKSAESGVTLRVEISALKLKRYTPTNLSYLEIDVKNYEKLNKAQRALAERVYGAGKDFSASMTMLNKDGVTRTRIYVLTPEYVKQHVKEGAIGCTSFLDYFSNSSDFLSRNDIDFNYGRLRGVRNVTAEGGAQEDMFDEHKYTQAFDAIISHPEKLTPTRAIVLLQFVAKYIAQNKQQ